MWVFKPRKVSDERNGDYVLYDVGFFSPGGAWHCLYKGLTRYNAADKVHYLNGGEKH